MIQSLMGFYLFFSFPSSGQIELILNCVFFLCILVGLNENNASLMGHLFYLLQLKNHYLGAFDFMKTCKKCNCFYVLGCGYGQKGPKGLHLQGFGLWGMLQHEPVVQVQMEMEPLFSCSLPSFLFFLLYWVISCSQCYWVCFHSFDGLSLWETEFWLVWVSMRR